MILPPIAASAKSIKNQYYDINCNTARDKNTSEARNEYGSHNPPKNIDQLDKGGNKAYMQKNRNIIVN